MDLLYGSAYRPYSWAVAYVAISYLILYVNTPMSIGLRAQGESAAVFRANLASTVSAVTLGVLFVYSFGLLGALAGVIASTIVISVVLGWELSRRRS